MKIYLFNNISYNQVVEYVINTCKTYFIIYFFSYCEYKNINIHTYTYKIYQWENKKVFEHYCMR